MLNLQKLRTFSLVPPSGGNCRAVVHCRSVDCLSVEGHPQWAHPALTAILSFRCWALFGGSYRILAILIAVYVCCLGFQLVGKNSFAIASMLTQEVEVPSHHHIRPEPQVFTGSHRNA